MSVITKKLGSTTLKTGDVVNMNLTTRPSPAGYMVETDNYFVHIHITTGLTVIDKKSFKCLYQTASVGYYAGATIEGDKVIFTKTNSFNLIAVVGEVTATNIILGVELSVTTSLMYSYNKCVPVVLENGKIIIAYETYSGTSSPFTINPKVSSLVFTSPNALRLYETKSLTLSATSTSNTQGYGISLYKADTNRVLVITGVNSPTLAGKMQIINVQSGNMSLGVQVTGQDCATISGYQNAYINPYCPQSILCDDNSVIIEAVGHVSNCPTISFIKVRLSDLNITKLFTSGSSGSSIGLANGFFRNDKIYVCTNTIGTYVMDKSEKISLISDNYIGYCQETNNTFYVCDEFTLYYFYTGTKNMYSTYVIARAGEENGQIVSKGQAQTLVEGEVGKTKLVTSIILGVDFELAVTTNRVEILLNGEILLYADETKLFPSSPIVIEDGDVLSIRNYQGVTNGQATAFGLIYTA